MADGFDSEEENESGSSLRKKLEATLSEKNSLEAEVRELRAKSLIAEKGYKHLSVEDLKQVSLSELEAEADKLEAQKAKADAEAVRRVLASRGLDGSELEEALKGLIGESDQAAQKASLDRIRAVGQTAGTPPSQVQNDEGLFGPSRIRAAYAKS